MSTKIDQRSLVVLLQHPLAEYRDVPVAAREVVAAGLTWVTDSWPSLAVSWIEQGVPLDQELVDLLIEIGQKSRWPQPLRHKAKALVRRWWREGR